MGLCWLDLAIEHLEDAKAALAAGRARSSYSRSYYAAYNASKATRYIVRGIVSLQGDDHGKASDLPDDFPDYVKWGIDITQLYEHRLKADYDNWARTRMEMPLTPAETVRIAEQFVNEARKYIEGKIGTGP